MEPEADRVHPAEAARDPFAFFCAWSPVGHAVVDPEGRVFLINAAAARMLGGPHRDWRDRSLRASVAPDQRAQLADHFRAACAGQAPYDPRKGAGQNACAVTVRVADSLARRHLQVFSRPYPADGLRLCLTVLLDVTAEAQSQALESQRQATLDALSANIAVLDHTGRITAVNEGWRRFALENGAPRENAVGVGMDYLDACANRLFGDRDDEADRALEGIRRVMAGERRDFTLEYPCHAPSAQRWFVMNVRPLGQGFGGVVVAHVDVTPRVLAEQEASRRREELAHAARLSSVTVLTASLIHEISQPLAAARLYVEAALSREGGSEPKGLGRILTALRDQVDRAIGIVQGLRRFMSRGAPTVEATELDARIRAGLALVAPLARRKRVRLEFDASSTPVWIRANPLQIEQVLVNLLANAIEAIDSADSEDRQVRVSLEVTAPDACVTVTDTGPGLDPHRAGQIFDVLETDKSSGMGLGLAISREIIENHGGRLWADTPASGTGAVLRFTLPRFAAAAGTA